MDKFSFIEGTISEDVRATFDIYSKSEYAALTNKTLYNYFQNPTGVTKRKVTEQDFEYISAFKNIYKEMLSEDNDYINYAYANWVRANFTILTKMKLYGYDRDNKNLENRYSDLKKVVRSNLGLLLKWKMIFSRKLILLYCVI